MIASSRLTFRALPVAFHTLQRPRMNALAPHNASQASKAAPKRRISKRLDQALDLLIDGTCRTQKAAAERVGLAPESLSRALKRHETRLLIEQKIENRVGSAKLKAASVLESIMMDGKSEHARKDIATWLLELQGYVVRKDAAPTLHIHNSIAVSPGYVIDLAPQPADSASVIEHEDSGTYELSSSLPTTRPTGGRR